MCLPKFYETFIPILEVLNNQEPLHYNDLKLRVRNKFYAHLPHELLNQKTRTGDYVILDRIGWGKTYLKQGGYLQQPARGIVQITEKGLAAFQKGKLSLLDLKNDPLFLSNRNSKKALEQHDVDIEGKSPHEMIDDGIFRLETQVKAELLEKLKNFNPHDFQNIVLKLLKKMGYGEYKESPKSRDGGIDGVMHQDKLGFEKIYIQAKRYNQNKVREKDIRNFLGAINDGTKGVFVTTSTFDDLAFEKVREHQAL